VTYSRFGFQAATNGEYALVAAERAGDDYEVENFDALLYRRVNGAWIYQRILFSEGRDFTTDFGNFPVVIGMKGNLASAELGDPHIAIFRFDGTDWVRMGTGPGPSEDVSIDADRLLYSVGESWNGEVFEPDGVGGWKSTLLPGQLRCCDDEFWGGPVDLLGDRAILATPYTYDLEPQEIPIYQRNGDGSWQLLSKLQVPAGQFRLGAEVALHDGKAIVAGRSGGPYVWSNFFGEPDQRLQAANSYARDASTGEIAKDGDLVAVYAQDPDLGGAVINLFRPDSSGKYQHVAVLKARAGAGVTDSLEIQGNTVIAGSDGKALVFELPASLTAPQPRHETFESGNGANWTPTAGSQFQVVRPTALNGVYRNRAPRATHAPCSAIPAGSTRASRRTCGPRPSKATTAGSG
jgi:hypothetical protein